MHHIKISHKKKSLFLLHVNACFLNKNFYHQRHLFSCTKKNFGIIGISERRIPKQVSLLNNLNVTNYSFDFTQTETSSGDTLLYIANHLWYKCRNDLMNCNILLLKLSTQDIDLWILLVLYKLLKQINRKDR